MEKALFIILALAEIALAVFTLAKQKTKKEWTRNRFAANGAEFVLYLIMALLPGIDFSFRFTGLLILLILRILISGIRFLIWRKVPGDSEKAAKKKNPAILILGTLLMILFTGIFMIPSFLFKDYKGRPLDGEYDVAMAHVILVDRSREESFENDGSCREVPIYIYYPENAKENETFPLVFFSHGAFGYYESNYSTYAKLVNHGYVVISMEHPYHSLYTNDTDGNLIIVDQTFINNAITVGNSDDINGDKEMITDEWITLRKADMNFAIDTIEAAKESGTLPSDCWYLCDTNENEILNALNLINCDKIGLMGHSLGGATATIVGRERDDIGAVIDLDGTMLGEKDYYAEPYPIPLLSFDNEGHYQDGMQAGSYYINNVIIDNALYGQHSYIAGAEHMNFTDLPLFSPTLASMFGMGSIDPAHCIDTVNDVVCNFMDSNLKGEGDYRVEEHYE